jgi:hypothetical protein
MAIIKLANVDDSATFVIKDAALVQGKFGPQIRFESDGGDLLFISQDTAMRQLGRIPLELHECAGETLTFSRSENKSGGAPYWNITIADAVERSQPAEPVRVPSPYVGKPIAGLDDFPPEEYGASVADPVPPLPPVTRTSSTAQVAPNAAKRGAIVDDYMVLLRHVAQHSGLTDQTAIQAAAATVFIAWDKAGVR